MSTSTPIYCQECDRANSASAKSCIWCGMPIVDARAPRSFETRRVEIEYLGGVERLSDPAPVKLVISDRGLELTEIMPGSRVVAIDALSIVGAEVIDASQRGEPEYAPRPWYWDIMLGPFARLIPRKMLPAVKKHDYLLTIRYWEGGQVRSAVFRREDSAGMLTVTGLAKIVNSLVRLSGREPQ
jgi:hypothetical protein